MHLEDLLDAIALVVERRAKLPAEVPDALAPLAKAGAWVMEKLPGADPFIRPWMIDRASDHYALDITRARTLLGWQPQRSLRDTIPKMVEVLKAEPAKFYEENKLGELPASVAEEKHDAATKKSA